MCAAFPNVSLFRRTSIDGCVHSDLVGVGKRKRQETGNFSNGQIPKNLAKNNNKTCWNHEKLVIYIKDSPKKRGGSK